jgi:pimeloyl-ACP methyl ester carboxylesterase
MQTVKLNARMIGDSNKPVLMIVHGLFGSSRNWSQLADQLAENYYVYVVDVRNHGNSPHAQVMDYPAMAADLTVLMTDHGIQSATILGHSMGGKIAMWLALTQPIRVQQLIVVDIAPIDYVNDFKNIFAAVRSVPLPDIESRHQADSYLAAYMNELSTRQFILQNLVNRNGQYTWRIPFDIIEQAIPEIMGFPGTSQVKPYVGSSLFVAGGQSDYLLVEHQNTINTLFPDYSMHTIENAGHWVHVQQPQKLLEMICKFC